jgi:hypothetical protein
VKGQWIVRVTGIGNLGVYRSAQKAESVAKRLNRDIRNAGAQQILTAVPEWVNPDVQSYRDMMLNELAKRGYRA